MLFYLKQNFEQYSQVCNNLLSLSEQSCSLSSILQPIETSAYTEEYMKLAVQKNQFRLNYRIVFVNGNEK